MLITATTIKGDECAFESDLIAMFVRGRATTGEPTNTTILVFANGSSTEVEYDFHQLLAEIETEQPDDGEPN